ncbi:hypothetical protein BDZ97DRAFT_1902721 [Flammula alnicola]|nr:hypothetical protein BDZ97DRAFT_1902721 [Flammula alnicola]
MSSLSQLTPLLSSTPYLLAYAIPLLLLSIFLTFSGTFFTVDRSRTFPPTDSGAENGYAALPAPGAFTSFDKPKRRFNWVLDGGVGGLAGGYAFGVHLSTALALIIPATTSSAPLSPKSFLAVWVLCCVITTPIAGRYRFAAFAFLGISGGTLTSLALCVIIHPSLPSRIILVGVFLALFTILVLLVSLLPNSRLTQSILHSLLRLCTSSTGAFGLVMAIALLLNPKEEGWANVWERLWLMDGPENPDGQVGWGSAQERGLSAAYAVFLFAGMAVDWALGRWIGECPDEKWDNYLAHYAANLPNQADRAGLFQPPTSLWDREKDILFPNETDLKTALAHQHGQLPLPVTMYNSGNGAKTATSKGIEFTRVPTSVEVLKKKSKRVGRWKMAGGVERKDRKPVKFGEISDSSDDDDDDDERRRRHAKRSFAVSIQPPAHSYTSSSTPTLVDGPVGRAGKAREVSTPDRDPRLDALDTLDYDQEIAQVKGQLRRHDGGDDDEVEYSDYEEDLTVQRQPMRERREGEEGKGWSPAFLKRHLSQNQGANQTQQPLLVPATPSLIKALDRLAVAHRDAFGPGASPSPPGTRAPSTEAQTAPVGLPGEEGGNAAETQRAPRWEEFWREVRVKAQS